MDDKRIIEQVRRLLAYANNPSTPPAEREQMLDEANKKMAKHAIDQAILDATRTSQEKRKPTRKHIQLFDPNFEYSSEFYAVITAMCSVNRCRYAWHSDSVTVVGMQEDVDWVELLWLNTFLYFSSKINPRWDVNLPLQQNIFNHKHSGMKWKEIYELAHRLQPEALPEDLRYEMRFIPNKCGWMKTMYHRECKRQEVAPVGTQTFAAYKLTFTNHFCWEVKVRLEAMAAANKATEDETSGSAVALFDVSKLIDEEFFRIFPMLHPEEKARTRELLRKNAEDAEKRDAEFLASLSPEARKMELDRRLRAERQAAKDYAQYYRSTSKRRTYDAAGATAGAEAGRSVDLTRAGKATGSGSRTELER